MIADLKPRVLVLDLSLPERQLTPEFVKTQLQSVDCTVAVSFANDDEAKALADSYGVTLLLDKMRLYDEIIPAIKRCPEETPIA